MGTRDSDRVMLSALTFDDARTTNASAGECEPDYDAEIWASHDEQINGPIDDDGMRNSYTDGSLWDCCNKDNTHPGCRTGKHEEEVSSKRVRS